MDQEFGDKLETFSSPYILTEKLSYDFEEKEIQLYG